MTRNLILALSLLFPVIVEADPFIGLHRTFDLEGNETLRAQRRPRDGIDPNAGHGPGNRHARLTRAAPESARPVDPPLRTRFGVVRFALLLDRAVRLPARADRSLPGGGRFAEGRPA